MKKTLFIAAHLAYLLCVQSLFANGQNGPVTLVLPTPNLVTLPQSFSPQQGSNNQYYYNYDRNYVPHYPISSTGSAAFTINPVNLNNNYSVSLSSTYKNGWGQIIEQIHRGWWTNNDIVVPYDLRPSLTKNNFLPYSAPFHSFFQLNTFSDQRAYYTSTSNPYSAEGGTSYSQSVSSFLSGSPAGSSYMPGTSFVGQQVGVTTAITYNGGNEVYNIVIGTNGYPNISGHYAANSLVVKTSQEPNDNMATKEYYDKDNLLVCKSVLYSGNINTNPLWLNTYYVYNDMKQLAFMLPPKVNMSSASISTTDVDQLGYSYTYDQFGKLIKQHTPGQNGNNYTVYDSQHRPILYQSPLLASQSQYQWKFFIYDNKDRVVMSGLCTSTNSWSDWMNILFPSSPTAMPPNYNGPVYLTDFYMYGYTGTYPSSIPNCDIQVYNYYDQYPVADPVISTATYAFPTTSFLNGVEMIQPQATPYMVTNGLLTANKVKVLDNTFPNLDIQNQWVTNVYFYDSKSRLAQKQTLNPWNAPPSTQNPNPKWDIHMYQYNFSGQIVLDILSYYDKPSSTKPTTIVTNKYIHDINQDSRLTEVQQQLDNNSWMNIASYQYDDMGRVRQKSLNSVEIQNYSYNIRGQLSGINADYVNNGANSNQNGETTFGCILNYDNGFSTRRYDGKACGILWRGSDNSYLRAYGYDYDPAGRLTAADFNEEHLSNWNHTNHDFSMSNVTYDKNGNIQSMNQRGNPTNSPPTDIDILTYNYTGNQLYSVSDAVTTNYNLGDFQDVSVNCSTLPPNSFCGDYLYDADGNMTTDSNKHIRSIGYNYQDLPQNIQFSSGIGSIANVYDANGNLLKKTINDQLNSKTIVYRYWGPFVYRNDSLLYVLHDEGRARYQADSGLFKYDYFVRDHQDNVRSVVTATPYPSTEYWASYEISAANFENAVFNNISPISYPRPGGNGNDQKAGMMNGGDSSRIGTSLMLHVMAGDQFNVNAQSYWNNDSAQNVYADSATMASTLFSTLINGSALGNSGEGTSTQIVNSMYSTLSGSLNAYQGLMDQATDSGVPRSYLNYLVFDENMNMLSEQSGAVQVSATSGSWQDIQLPNITAQQNGYIIFFMSNATPSPVYMDHFSVYVYKSNLLQEQNYYPYGLAVKEGQSTNPNEQPNKFLFECNENHDELGLNLNDFNYRQYDYQIGRFTSVDPLADNGQESLSPYHFAFNDPANFTDPFGLGPSPKSTLVPSLNDLTNSLDNASASASTYSSYWSNHDISPNVLQSSNDPQGATCTVTSYFWGPMFYECGQKTWTKYIRENIFYLDVIQSPSGYSNDDYSNYDESVGGSGNYGPLIADAGGKNNKSKISKTDYAAMFMNALTIAKTEMAPYLAEVPYGNYIVEGINLLQAMYYLGHFHYNIGIDPKSLPWTPGVSPGPGWKWQGEGEAGMSNKGNWTDGNGNSLNPDLDHKDPKGPHWGLKNRNTGLQGDITPDGEFHPTGKGIPDWWKNK